jgi:hypothetical protein
MFMDAPSLSGRPTKNGEKAEAGAGLRPAPASAFSI